MFINLLHRLVHLYYLRCGFQSKMLAFDRCSLHYYEYRNENAFKTVLFVHGLGTSASSWLKVLPGFSPDFNIIAIDLPGFGFSKISDSSAFFSVQEQSDTLRRFVDHVLVDRFALIGHSLGGWLSARHALEDPGRVHQLVMINNAGIYYPGAEQQREYFDLKTWKDVNKLIDQMWSHCPWYFRPFAPAILSDMKRRQVPNFVKSVQQEEFLNDSLRRLSIPVHIIWGKEDRLVSLQAVELMREAIPHLKVHYIERCGHVPQLERPRELRAALRAILSEEPEARIFPPHPGS